MNAGVVVVVALLIVVAASDVAGSKLQRLLALLCVYLRLLQLLALLLYAPLLLPMLKEDAVEVTTMIRKTKRKTFEAENLHAIERWLICIEAAALQAHKARLKALFLPARRRVRSQALPLHSFPLARCGTAVAEIERERRKWGPHQALFHTRSGKKRERIIALKQLTKVRFTR
jgi:hypothetical protein